MMSSAVELLNGHRIAVLTGAGLSTDSGIPDYRGPDSAPRKPMTFQQYTSDAKYRQVYWARNYVGYQFMSSKQPNAAHRALAEAESAGLLTGIITQNVDTLHEKAGSKNVVDLHGRFDQTVCQNCANVFSRTQVQDLIEEANPEFLKNLPSLKDIEIAPDADAVLENIEGFVVPPCPICGGQLKPNVVFFGEFVPVERVTAAHQIIDDATALLVAGTSLHVHSGLRFVRRAANAGKPVLIINQGVTKGDPLATLKLDGGVSDLLPPLISALTQVSAP